MAYSASISKEALDVGVRYYASDLLGTTLEVSDVFNMQKILMMAVEILLLVIAVVVAVLTFAHLIDQDAATVALYRAMGASTDNIYTIYLFYLIELCLLAMVATVLIALVFVGGVVLTSAGELVVKLQEFYNLSYLPKVTFCSFNKDFWLVMILELITAPITLFFTLRRFSPKHVAKKLKEDDM